VDKEGLREWTELDISIFFTLGHMAQLTSWTFAKKKSRKLCTSITTALVQKIGRLSCIQLHEVVG